MMYAHASDITDQYAGFLTMFQSWTAGMDAIFDASASQTNGTRHIRFVHDSNCSPIILNVTLSPTGDDNFSNMIDELEALGYNRHDRKYIVFMDAQVYCAIGMIAYDDLWSGYNGNNDGDSFSRVDAGCWSDVIPAHELMHQLGGVQLSAPHSSGESHCFDAYDIMCVPTNGTPVQIVCPDLSQGGLFDCNHDDYYTTDASMGSYLNGHWNTAINQFLILPLASRVESLFTLHEANGELVGTDVFYYGEKLYAQIHLVDQYNLNLANVDVILTINQPNGSALCTLTVNTDAAGIAQAVCPLIGKFSYGIWTVRVNNFTIPGYPSDTSHSMMNHPFMVLWKVFFPNVLNNP